MNSVLRTHKLKKRGGTPHMYHGVFLLGGHYYIRDSIRLISSLAGDRAYPLVDYRLVFHGVEVNFQFGGKVISNDNMETFSIG